jgi:hypothetical protein
MLSSIVRQRYEKNPKMHEFFYFFMQMIKLLSLSQCLDVLQVLKGKNLIKVATGKYNGIKKINAIDWLMGK